MVALDAEHVLVDYTDCFYIPDFEKIRTASILNYADGGSSYGIATRDDYSGAFRQAKTVFQRLKKGAQLKAKLSPCIEQYFCVRLTFDEGYVDSEPKKYIPKTFEEARDVKALRK